MSKILQPRVALIPLARSTFDTALASELTDKVRIALENAGLVLSGPGGFVSDLDSTAAVSQSLLENPPDLLVLLQATFSDSTMACKLAKLAVAPILLWALPEPHTGGRLRLNSFCGVNLAAHALQRRGHYYDYVYASPNDPAALDHIKNLALAGSILRSLRQTRIGRVGEHPEGFDTCRFNGDALKSKFGVEIVQVELDRVFHEARKANPKRIDSLLDELAKSLDGLYELDQTAVRGTLAVYLALRRIAQEESLDGMGIRCWPRFFTDLGCAACGAMSMLSEEMIPCSCEADINGTITQYILQSLGGGPAFGSDLVSVDRDKNTAVLWHCGLAPLSMADPSVRPRGTIHSNRMMPLLMEFPLKPGMVTIARLSEASGDYRLVVGRGEVLRAHLNFSGTSGVLRFHRPISEVLDIIMTEGLEHHMSITYGDVTPSLLALAKILGLEVVSL